MNMISNLSRKVVSPVLAGALVLGIPVAMVASAPVATAQASQLDQAVSALRSISTLKANFTQTDRNGQRVQGELTLKQPGKIRFEYEKSANMLIVSDGSALTMVDYDVAQVQRWPIRNSPLGALLDPNRDVARYGKLQPTNSPDVVSIEVRDPQRPEYGVITLIMVRDPKAPGGLELRSWVALDSQNQRTTVRLSGHRYGVSVPDSAFRFRDPRVTTRRPG